MHQESGNNGLTQVLFVCQLNFCRSPLAQGVFQAIVDREGKNQSYWVDSAGVNPMVGAAPDGVIQQLAKQNGIDISQYHARQFTSHDAEEYDIILAIDEHIARTLKNSSPKQYQNKIKLLLNYDPKHRPISVPSNAQGEAGRVELYEILSDACEGLFQALENNKNS